MGWLIWFMYEDEEKQAAEAGIPLTVFLFSENWSTEVYRSALNVYVEKFKSQGISYTCCGWIDMRDERIKK